MGSVKAARVVDVETTPDVVADRLRAFARTNDFTSVVDNGRALVFEREGAPADSSSFDPQNVSTKLVTSLETTGDLTRVVVTITTTAPLLMFNAGDQAGLEKYMDRLANAVTGKRKPYPWETQDPNREMPWFEDDDGPPPVPLYPPYKGESPFRSPGYKPEKAPSTSRVRYGELPTVVEPGAKSIDHERAGHGDVPQDIEKHPS